MRFVSKFRAEQKSHLVKSSIITSLVAITGASLLISGLVIGLSEFLASSYFEASRAVPVLIILSIWFFFMSFHNFLAATLRGFKDFFGKTLGEIIRNLTPVVGVIVFSLSIDLGLVSASIFYLIGPIISAILFYTLLKRRHYGKMPETSGSFSKPLLKKMVTFGLPLILSGTAVSVIGSTDTLMLTGLRPLGDVGLYQVARLTKPVLMYFGAALAMPLFPVVSELWAKGDKKTLQNTLKILTKFSFILMIPVALIFLTFPEMIIRIFFGAKYLAAANAMRILAVASVFWVMGRSFESTLSGIGKTTLVLRAIGSAAIFNIIANLLLIPLYGATGAAIATGLSFLISFILCIYYSRREIEFPLPFSALLKTGTGGVLTLLLIIALKGILPLPTWPELFIILISSSAFYIVWLFGTKIIVKKDLEIIEASAPIPKKIISILERIAQE